MGAKPCRGNLLRDDLGRRLPVQEFLDAPPRLMKGIRRRVLRSTDNGFEQLKKQGLDQAEKPALPGRPG